jgi:2-phospho-L-lactate guanylyltransferase
MRVNSAGTRIPGPIDEALAVDAADDDRRRAWAVVIPAKAPVRAKTRLAPHLDDTSRMALARAFAADTVAAALAAASVARVIVVGDDPSLAGDAEFLDERAPDPGRAPDTPTREDHIRGPEPRILHETRPRRSGRTGRTGLTGAIAFGIGHARATGAGNVAVLLGDVPCLRPGDLDEALALAAEHPLAFVPDADATGTTLATALEGETFEPRFGPDSASEHARAGFVRLEASARLRRDVDTLAALEDAITLGTGVNTAHVVATLADRRPAD